MDSNSVPQITLAERGDLTVVRALLRESSLPVEGLEALIGSLLVARVGSRVVGCAALEDYPPATLLRSVAVSADGRGLGLGGRLAQAALEMARERGLRRVFLLTETAEQFFLRFGFRVVDRSHVDEAVRGSREFAALCPATAVAMALEL